MKRLLVFSILDSHSSGRHIAVKTDEIASIETKVRLILLSYKKIEETMITRD